MKTKKLSFTVIRIIIFMKLTTHISWRFQRHNDEFRHKNANFEGLSLGDFNATCIKYAKV